MSVVLACDDEGAGPPLLLIHGFPLDRRMWLPLAEHLRGTRRCVSVDLRAHGASAGPPAATMEALATDIVATMDQLGITRADVCGWSMGGYVAIAVLRGSPDRVRSLILSSTKLAADSPMDSAARDAAIARLRASGTAILHDELWGVMSTSGDEDAFRAAVGRLSVEAAVADLLAMRDRPDGTEPVNASIAPVLWIAGERDRVVPPDAQREAAATVGASFMVIPGAGHLVPTEDPERFAAAIETFLRNGERGRGRPRSDGS